MNFTQLSTFFIMAVYRRSIGMDTCGTVKFTVVPEEYFTVELTVQACWEFTVAGKFSVMF